MRRLIDENLPPRIASLLNDVGHDAVHVRDVGAAGALDTRVIDVALADERTIVSAETDSGALLAATGAWSAPGAMTPRLGRRSPADLP